MNNLIFFNLYIDKNIVKSVGGGRLDKNHILRYLNNKTYPVLKSIGSSDGLQYVFTIDKDNEKEEFNSRYLGSGFYNTAILINLLSPETEKIKYPHNLVLKIC